MLLYLLSRHVGQQGGNNMSYILLFILQLACTDFVLKGADQNLVEARSMEFNVDLESNIMLIPKEQTFTSQVDEHEPVQWTNRFAVFGMNVFGSSMLSDGMNEEGLSLGVLWFPQAVYPKIDLESKKPVLLLEDLPLWLLGSFSTTEEAVEALQGIQIYPASIQGLNQVPTIHLTLQDRSGNGYVVEFLNGEMRIEKNPVGVLTNMPSFSWQLTNLSNYINLTAMNTGNVSFDGSVLDPTGEGSGLLGIPGDWTPPSRFVKIAILKNFVKIPTEPGALVNLGFHLLNTVDIPYGAVQGVKGQSYDYTQWAIVKDLKNKKVYYRTYLDLSPKMLDLTKEFAQLKQTEQRPLQGAKPPK